MHFPEPPRLSRAVAGVRGAMTTASAATAAAALENAGCVRDEREGRMIGMKVLAKPVDDVVRLDHREAVHEGTDGKSDIQHPHDPANPACLTRARSFND
ncbi:hypothetical protein ACQPZJ_35710 [Actinoplanes sp. CA-054009]